MTTEWPSRDAHNPNGEIAITCTGLRFGEKLYEELLIDAESEPAKHLIGCRQCQLHVEVWQVCAAAHGSSSSNRAALLTRLESIAR